MKEYRAEVMTALSDGMWTPLYRVDGVTMEPIATYKAAEWVTKTLINEHDEIRRKKLADGVEDGVKVHEIYEYRIMEREVGEWHETEKEE